MQPKTMTPDEKFERMTNTPIPKLLLSLSIPTIVSMLISSVYNIADTYFIGRIGSASATGAIGVVMPLMSIIQAFGFMFGHGSGNHIARTLGAQDHEDAERTATTGFVSAILAGVAIMLIGLICLRPMVFWLGSTETIAPYAIDYARIILFGAPWMVPSLVLNNQLRFQGSAFYGMIGISSGAALNIALDPLFIFVFDMGVSGAALATILSQLAGFFLLFAGTRRGGNVRIRLRAFAPSRAMYREIFRGGVPSLCRQGIASVASICLNAAAGGFGDTAVAAISIVNRVMMVANSAVIGVGQGFQPICGFNYGAKRYDRVRKAFWFSTKATFGLLVVVSIVAIIFAPQIIELFLRDNDAVRETGAMALRLYCLFAPLFAFVIMSNMMMQTMGLAGRASLMAAARQGLFFLPSILLLPRAFGLLGVELAQPVSDLLSFALCVPLTVGVLRSFSDKTDEPPAEKP